MKLSNFLVSVGFLTLSVALPAPTPTFTGVNVVPTSGTMTTVIPTPAPNLMPRFDVDLWCAKVDLGIINNDNIKKYTLPRDKATTIHFAAHRLKPRYDVDLKAVCQSLRDGKYVQHQWPAHGQTSTITVDLYGQQ